MENGRFQRFKARWNYTDTPCTAGERFFVVAESYAGHGPRLEKGGPCPDFRTAVPEPPEFQVKVGDSDFGIWNEDAFQLLMDVFTLSKLSEGLDPKSLRAMKINQGLLEFTFIADLNWTGRTE